MRIARTHRKAIVSELPDQTLALCELAVDITGKLADALRREAASDPSRRPDLARSLNNLSNQLSALGRREAALAAIQEAVDIRWALAAARPDAFRPDLAVSLWVLADRLDESGDRPGGLAANAEAIGILTPSFLQLPAAHAPSMAGMIQEYLQRCEKLECEPSKAFDPLLPVFETLQQR